MMKLNNTISLVVLNYNGKEHLKEYFSSVTTQSKKPDAVYLMDNGSTDGSIAYVKKHFPWVTIISYTKKNLGTAGSSNYAFKKVKTDYVVFQSNDIRLDIHCIENLHRAILKLPQAGIVTSVLLQYGKDPHTKKHHIDNAGGIVDRYGFGMQQYPNQIIDSIPNWGEVFFSYGGSFIISSALFRKIGGYDDRYFTLNDDIDLSWRARLYGYHIYYTSDSVVYHKVSATLGIRYDRPIKRYWSERNMLRTVLKNYRIRDFLTRFPVYILLYIAQMIFLLYKKKWRLIGANGKAVLWNIWYFPDTVTYRRQIKKRISQTVEPYLYPGSLKIKLFSAFQKAF